MIKEIPQRRRDIDVLRGIIMCLMALDHIVYFVGRFHAAEFWSTPAPMFPLPALEVFRLLSHLCAPGFVFLAGASTSLQFRGLGPQPDTHAIGTLRRRMLLRGIILLVVVQIILESIAWLLGSLGGKGINLNAFAIPGAPDLPSFLYLGVIYAIAASMMLASLLLRAPNPVLWIMSLIGIVSSSVIISWRPEAEQSIHPILNLLFVPGNSGVYTAYPLFPWFSIFLLGMVFGRLKNSNTSPVRILAISIALLAAGTGLRFVQPYGEFHESSHFWVLSKYPPSPAFIFLTLGCLGLLLTAIDTIGTGRRTFLETFGREPLFFYLLHLYGYGWLCFFVITRNPLILLLLWILSLALFYPLVRLFSKSKRTPHFPRWLNWL